MALTNGRVFLLVLLFGGSAVFLGIDGRSAWTDEIGTWSLTVANGPADWMDRFWHYHNSDGQIPLYHLFMYLWAGVAGTSEIALRVANVPWLILAVYGLSRLQLGQSLKLAAIAVFCLHPLLWYQLNEARPYVLHLAGACWLLVACVNLQTVSTSEQSASCWRELLVGTFLLVGSSALGVFWIVGALVAIGVGNPKPLLAALASCRRQAGFTLVLALATAALCVVAVHSHLSGARASLAADFSMAGLAYGGMELLGAAGLGPSRHELRGQVLAANHFQLGLMLGATLIFAATLVMAWLKLSVRHRLMVALGLLLPIVGLAMVGHVLHWRVVGRHLSGGLPLICLGFAYFGLRTWQSGRLAWRALALLALVLLLTSALSIRFATRHEKDDYRQAAAWAREALAQGRSVLWLANERAIGYYRLSGWSPEGVVDLPAGLIPYTHLPTYLAAGHSLPDVVIFSPREGVDPKLVARPVLQTGQYVLTQRATAFELYLKH